MATTMTAKHDVIDHLPARLRARVRAFCEDEKISTKNFFAKAINYFFTRQKEEEEKFTRDAIRIHEEAMAEKKLGKVVICHNTKEVLEHLDNLDEIAQRESAEGSMLYGYQN